MTGWIYATEAAALRAAAAITVAQGATETLREQGRLVERPRKTWAAPAALRDGTFAVPFKARIRGVLDVPVVVDGTPARTPREVDATPIDDRDREAAAAAPVSGGR